MDLAINIGIMDMARNRVLYTVLLSLSGHIGKMVASRARGRSHGRFRGTAEAAPIYTYCAQVGLWVYCSLNGGE